MKELLTLSEFIDDNQLAVKVLRRSPQPEYELHSHEFAELVIVYGGRGEHFTPHNSAVIEAGDVFVIHGSMKHGYRKVEALELVKIMFNISGFDNPLLELARFPAFHALFLLAPQFQHSAGGAMRLKPLELREIMARVERMELEQKDKAAGYRMMVTAAFMELIALLSRYYAAGETQKAVGPMLRLAKVMAAVAEDSAKPWTRNKMAAMSGMSNSTLTRFFNRFVGCSPVEYLLRARIKRACALLSFPDLTISGIAASCGFSDSNYFCRQFRRRMKCSPLEHRKFILKTRE